MAPSKYGTTVSVIIEAPTLVSKETTSCNFGLDPLVLLGAGWSRLVFIRCRSDHWLLGPSGLADGVSKRIRHRPSCFSTTYVCVYIYTYIHMCMMYYMYVFIYIYIHCRLMYRYV